MSAPFHCALMRPAAERLAVELPAVPQGAFRFPVVANVTPTPYGAGDRVAEVLIRQITAPVRWEESVRGMRESGADCFLEVGPGKVLSGLVRRIEKDAPTAAFCAPAELDSVLLLLLPYSPGISSDLGARLSYVHQQSGKPLVAYVPHVEKYRILIEGFELNNVPVASSIDGAAFMVEAMRRCRPC